MYSIRKSKKTLKFDNAEVNKKEFNTSKQISTSVTIDQILISDKFKHSDTSFKYFIGYKDNNIIRLLCIIWPQMSDSIKYFGNDGKNMSHMIEDNSALFKYSNVWNKFKKNKGIKFHSNPVYDERYIKAKVK